MKNKSFSKNCLISCIAAALGLNGAAFAKTLTLYEEPKSSKVVASVDSAKGVISIFTSKDKQWVKVADPSNGNVGWVKAEELAHDVTVSTNLYSTTSSNNGHSMLSFGQHSEEMLKFMHEQEQAMQKFFSTANNFPSFGNFPMMSVFIIPPGKVDNVK